MFRIKTKIFKQLLLITQNQFKIMSQIEDLTAKVTEVSTKVNSLQVAIDADKVSDAKVVSDLTAANADLKATVASLQAQLAGGNPVAIQAAIDSLTAISTKLDAAAVDVAGPDA